MDSTQDFKRTRTPLKTPDLSTATAISQPRELVEKYRHKVTEPKAHAPLAQKTPRCVRTSLFLSLFLCALPARHAFWRGAFVANDGFSSALLEAGLAG